MRRKKKGSTLITVVAIFAVLFTVGTSVLALTASSYQSRVLESRRVENLYASESGIDIAYAITGKVVEQAIKAGNDSVATLIADHLSSTAIEEEKTKMKNGSISDPCYFPTSTDSTKSRILNSDYSLNMNQIKMILNDTFKSGFKGIINRELLLCVMQGRYLQNYSAVNNSDKYLNAAFTSGSPNFSKSLIEIKDDANNNVDINSATKFLLKIVSNYHLDSSTGNQEREIEANYTINIPDYSGVYGANNTIAQMGINPVTQKAIAIDGDLSIRGKLKVNNGPVFVKGNDPVADNTTTVSYSKYNGGILIDSAVKYRTDAPGVTFGGDVVTSNTFRLINNGTVSISGDLYSNNIYVGKNQTGNSQNNDLTISGQAVLDNDLAVNSTNSNISITNGLYAISDISNLPSGKNQKARSSSSIIINSDDYDSNHINISKEALIMGTAYINIGEQYQTGESVAVKGNYTAYTTMIPDESGNGFYYTYYPPLQLIDKVGIIVDDKSRHFYQYYNINKDTDNALRVPANINLPERDGTKSVGAYISGGRVYEGRYTMTAFEELATTKKDDYATQVYEMGNLSGITAAQSYTNGTVNRTVSNQVIFGSKYFNSITTDAPNPVDKVIIDYNSADTVVLVGNDVNYSGNSNEKVIKADSSGKISGIVVTAGNIKAYGTFNFTGTLISEGNMDIDSNADVTINYNSNYIQETLKKYYSEFKDLFDSTNHTSVTNVESDQRFSIPANASNAIDPKKIIQKGIWKINQ